MITVCENAYQTFDIIHMPTDFKLAARNPAPDEWSKSGLGVV